MADLLQETNIAQNQEDNSVGVAHRIMYVEPNDVYDKGDGKEGIFHELTPRYEDMCVYFNLIIEKTSRFKVGDTDANSTEAKNANGGGKTFNISWSSDRATLFDKKVSVLQGDRTGGGDNISGGNANDFKYYNEGYNYLTTYYTDIDFDGYVRKTEIEGLGVESVQISYESWYTPTIVIKFVDVRGSAIFGREEAIHVDEKLQVDNIFGAFFTMPYPLFRLQVKGFLGKPVTYQLTCSNFNGSFNASTGNFEATVTFIGYSWSLLTDIPFMYLVAAPECSYLGREYWDRKRSSKEWALWDDGGTVQPIKLSEFFKKVEHAEENAEQMNKGSEEDQRIDENNVEKGELTTLKTKLNDFINALKKSVDNRFYSCVNGKEEQLVLFSSSSSWSDSDTSTKYKAFYDELKKFTDSHKDSDITISHDLNSWGGNLGKLTFKSCFTINGTKSKIKGGSIQSTYGSGMSEYTASDLTKLSTKETTQSNIREYVYVVDIKDLYSLIDGRVGTIDSETDEITKNVEAKIEYNVKELLSFKPFIGNFFKLMFIHLEVFAYIIQTCGEEIYKQITDGQRVPSVLGLLETGSVANDVTDIKDGLTKNIGPWPAIYDNGVETQQAGYKDSNIANIYGWCGDFSTNFLEEKVVKGIQEGVRRFAQPDASDFDKSDGAEYSYFPITPTDFNGTTSPFSGVDASDADTISGLLSIRAALTMGLASCNVDSKTATQFGKMDAYNYYAGLGNTETLKTIASMKNLSSDVIFNIATCGQVADEFYTEQSQDGAKKWFKFETNQNASRHSMFDASGNFTHWQTKSGISLVPTKLNINFKGYEAGTISVLKKDVDGDKVYYLPKAVDGVYKDVMFNVSSSSFGESGVVSGERGKVISDDTTVSKLKGYLDKIKGGEELAFGKHKVSTDSLKDYYSNVYVNESENYYANNSGVTFYDKETLDVGGCNFDGTTVDYNKDITVSPIKVNKVSYKDGAFVKSDGSAIDEGNVMLLPPRVVCGRNENANIFSTAHYIAQYDNTNVDDRNRYLGLLLLTAMYKPTCKEFSSEKSIKEVSLIGALFVGAYLWHYKGGVVTYRKYDNSIKIIDFKKHEVYMCKNGNTYTPTMPHTDTINYATLKDVCGYSVGSDFDDDLIELFKSHCSDGGVLFRLFSCGNFNTANYNNKNKKFIDDYYKTFDEIHKKPSVKERTTRFMKEMNGSGIFSVLGKRYKAISRHNISGASGVSFDGVFRDDNEIHGLARELYKKTVFLVKYSCLNNKKVVNVSPSNLKSYFSGFLEGVKEIVNKKEEGETATNEDGKEVSVTDNRDLSLSIYYYLKNLWDKWFVIAKPGQYNVENYFDKNFIFTDSFYRNTYRYLALNCGKLLNLYLGKADNCSLFTFISHVVKDHNCTFMPVPDWVGFKGDNADREVMNDLFRPIAVDEALPKPELDNKFVIMYVQPYSSKNSEDGGYKLDSFDIYSHTKGGFSDVAKLLFADVNKSTDSDDIMRREGYFVPCFGVAFGRQNNHIFKNISASMDNPVTTEQSIKVQSDIAKMGSGAGKKYVFTGQDIFNVFTNYSYSVTIEMLGNAQIAPLMYFQLMNVPMWRGTYMVYKVSHSMVAGQMTTTIVGMKMSKYSRPFNSTFFMKNLNYTGDINGGSCGSGGASMLSDVDAKAGVFTGKSWKEQRDMLGLTPEYLEKCSTVYGQAQKDNLIVTCEVEEHDGKSTIQMHKLVVEDIKQIMKEIKETGFKGKVTSSYRPRATKSRHNVGIAVDINGGSGGNPYWQKEGFVPYMHKEPSQGDKLNIPFNSNGSPYHGTYDASKCCWHSGHPVVKIFNKHGWGWGGAFGDVMHFSLAEEACYRG